MAFLVAGLDALWSIPLAGQLLLRLGYRASIRRRGLGPVKLERMDHHDIPEGPGEIRLFMNIRNQAILLPAFLRHYTALGVDRFFIVDHESSDAPFSHLSALPNVHVYRTQESFFKTRAGIDWTHALLHEHGTGRWCLVVDADELLIYPRFEVMPLPGLVQYLEETHVTALFSLLLDMYSPIPLSKVQFSPEEDLLETFPLFDPDGFTLRRSCRRRYSGAPDYIGGSRARMFGKQDMCLNKVSLFKYGAYVSVGAGHHYVIGARVSSIQGALLHFKFGPWFRARLEDPTSVAAFLKWGDEYPHYVKALAADHDISFVYGGSETFRNSDQLVALGIMKTSPAFEEFVQKG